MTNQSNYSMNELEAVQIARKSILFLEQILYMIEDLMANQGLTFLHARNEALETLENDEFGFILRPKFDEKKSLIECLYMCFPELSAKSREGISKWKLKKARKFNQSKKRNPGWNLINQVDQRVIKCLPLPKVKIDLNEELPEEWCNLSQDVVQKGKLLSFAFGSKARRKYQAMEFYPEGIFYSFFREQHARAPRSCNRSVKKKSDDSGGGGDSDGDSDQGDPPGPSLVVPSLQTSQLNQILYSSAFSRMIHPCCCCMDWRWAA